MNETMRPPESASTTRSQACWEVRGDQLVRIVGGREEVPTAAEIYSLVFESDDAAVQNLGFSPEQLTFSRYPAQINATITYSEGAQASGLACIFKAVGGGHAVSLSSLKDRKADHIIINRRWFPFAAGAREEILDILGSVSVLDDGLSLTLRQYLALKTKSRVLPWLNDETENLVIHPGINSPLAADALIDFKGKLYPYQKTGWQWLSFILREGLGAVLADEMGLGKTIQVIALLAGQERRRVSPSLIIAPGTLLENWRREIEKFAPALQTYIHQGTRRTGNYRDLVQHDVVITSYDTVVRDGGMFKMVEWPLVIIDEAQAIKNPDTKRAASIKSINRKVSIAVTGTPIENKLLDLWSIVDFCIPGYLGKASSFEQRFNNDAAGASAVEPLVSPIMLRRKVAEVAKDLPPRIEIPQILAFDEAEAAEYERVRHDTVKQYGGAASLVALTRLRMFCAHPMLLEEIPWSIDQAATFGKFRRLFEIVDEIFSNREKVLVFTSYNRMAELIVRTVRDRYGVFADIINGETPVDERQRVVDCLAKEAAAGLLALNPKAAGTGLNITAASHVIHYNLEWNPAVEDQASARAHRRGQDRPVTIHRLYFADSVEEAVNDRLSRKRELSQKAIVGVEGADEEIADIMRALQASPTAKVRG